MMFSGFLDGIRKIWENDSVSQEHYLTYLGEKVRSLPLQVFKDFGAIFVPNDEYLRYYFGEACMAPEYEIYDFDGLCVLNNCMVFPCLSLLNECVGWISFNPFLKAKAAESGVYSESYYSYPSSRIFNKGSYLFVRPDVYKKALTDSYLIVTDGVFDAINLVYNGFNAASILGSHMSAEVAFMLSFIKNVYVSIDNDDAGLRMFSEMRKFIPTANYIKQGVSKDVDDILKLDIKEEFKAQVWNGIYTGVSVNLRKHNT